MGDPADRPDVPAGASPGPSPEASSPGSSQGSSGARLGAPGPAADEAPTMVALQGLGDPQHAGDDATAEEPGVPPAAPAPQVLGGRYLLEERIASGGMASVWRAHDEKLSRTVAVKILHDHLAADEAFRERFRREAITAAKLTHPNVVSTYDTGTDGDRVYLVMEYVEGVTLRDVMVDLGTLDLGQAAAIGEKVARALDSAHQRGLVHRDVKPANILVGADGTVKVADFGIAKAEEDAADLTRTGMVLGTAAYVAPEQIMAQPIDGKADQYALGCVLYEAITGRRAFQGDSAVATAAQRLEHDPLPMRSLRADVPKGLDQVVLRAMSRSPADRYPSAGHLADALLVFADTDTDQTAMLAGGVLGARDEPAPAAATGGQESFLRTEGRWLAPVFALMTLATLLVGVGLATGVLEAGDGFPIQIARNGQPEAPPAPEVELVAPVAITSFDPQGDDRVENEDMLPWILDGDPETSWRADLYRTAAFGNLKEGVGFWVDLGQPHHLETVTLRTPTLGIDYELRAAPAPAARVDGWRVVGAVAGASGVVETRFPEPVTTQYLLVWVTGNLQPEGRGFTARFSAMAVRGTPADPADPTAEAQG